MADKATKTDGQVDRTTAQPHIDDIQAVDEDHASTRQRHATPPTPTPDEEPIAAVKEPQRGEPEKKPGLSERDKANIARLRDKYQQPGNARVLAKASRAATTVTRTSARFVQREIDRELAEARNRTAEALARETRGH